MVCGFHYYAHTLSVFQPLPFFSTSLSPFLLPPFPLSPPFLHLPSLPSPPSPPISPVPPDPPTDLQVIPGSETIESLDISWVNPMFTGFSDISEFRVEILGGTNVTNKTFTGNESTTQRLLDGLEPFTLYTIRLTVINMVGLEGTMSAETTGMTLSLCML